MCELDDCEKAVNRDGLCFKHKLDTVSINTQNLKKEREGKDVTGGAGTATYVRDMYESRRAAGLPDPIPENREAARYAPARGVFR